MAPKKVEPDLLTIPQAAELLGTSRQALWKAINAKRLETAARYGRMVLIKRSVLAAYKKTRRPGRPPSKKKRPG